MVFACRRPHFSLLRQRKVSKRKATRLVRAPARFGKWPSFRRDIHVSTSLKRTSCAFSSHFPPVLGELVWESKSKAKAKVCVGLGACEARLLGCRRHPWQGARDLGN